MIGHQARLRENDNLPLWRAPAIKKSRALVTHAIMQSKDA